MINITPHPTKKNSKSKSISKLQTEFQKPTKPNPQLSYSGDIFRKISKSIRVSCSAMATFSNARIDLCGCEAHNRLGICKLEEIFVLSALFIAEGR
jgi:hypothetical protein